MAEVTPVHFSATNGINVDLSRNTEVNESSALKANMPQFSEVSLNKDCVSAKIKSPRKILHFSDGVLEEYSSEDESEALVPDTSNLTVADPAQVVPFVSASDMWLWLWLWHSWKRRSVYVFEGGLPKICKPFGWHQVNEASY
ncbi:hypothetical protein HPB47_021637 [Ixodes persulcatus]|uniref:Uncharacterized protein n=1 Tax=Ixodes persulcatus TaxID=34615 RepID=A0AC60QEI2_IXOPE|nr:hypothetical protein HPB47_021637 [Ixodes persulcatus]